MAFEGTKDKIASSFMFSKGLILCMFKEMKEECHEESKLREKMMVVHCSVYIYGFNFIVMFISKK